MAAISTVIFVPAYTVITTQNLTMTMILCVATVVMLLKHWENIVRIIRREEIGLRSTAKGEKRIDK